MESMSSTERGSCRMRQPSYPARGPSPSSPRVLSQCFCTYSPFRLHPSSRRQLITADLRHVDRLGRPAHNRTGPLPPPHKPAVDRDLVRANLGVLPPPLRPPGRPLRAQAPLCRRHGLAHRVERRLRPGQHRRRALRLPRSGGHGPQRACPRRDRDTGQDVQPWPRKDGRVRHPPGGGAPRQRVRERPGRGGDPIRAGRVLARHILDPRRHRQRYPSRGDPRLPKGRAEYRAGPEGRLARRAPDHGRACAVHLLPGPGGDRPPRLGNGL